MGQSRLEPSDDASKSDHFFLLSSLPSVFLARRDIVLGYGSVHIPTAPGTYNLKVRLYKPLASSLLQHLTSWITKVQPEFVDPKFPTQTEGREVVRAQSSGHAIVTVNVMTRVSPLFSLSVSVSLYLSLVQNLTQLARSLAPFSLVDSHVILQNMEHFGYNLGKSQKSDGLIIV